MRPPFIGTVSVFLKLMPHIVAITHAVKKPPEALILELREIGDRILCRSNCGTLCCTDMGTNSLVDPVSSFLKYPKLIQLSKGSGTIPPVWAAGFAER